MNILVGCKVVFEEQDIAVNSDNSLDFSRANPKISQFDLNALQVAVDIKSTIPEANIKVVSIGGKNLENSKVRKDILSRGADELNIVMSDKFENILASDTAEIFKLAAQNLGFDLIICADGSADLFAGQVGIRTASLLNVPAINAVSKIISVDSSKIVVLRELENETQELEIALPAVICVSADINEPAIPGMKAILAAAKKPVNSLNLEVNLNNLVNLVEVKAPKRKDRLKIIAQSDSDEALAEFISNFKKAL
ncbi:putative electron transfer flavoprotein FixA [Campylobacter gastrosuis]|uniref:Electron transfer flavoprotein FixA n=1 Tax=Campylobacter gastrosuis TaxID=2974576 RepID=A0ABT7HSJ0_9BACT|nr:putative electron transfer flavoprotein FixA [Campylobacter gastrosuis]MDL0089799.1 putative electron transfer flavoprotein FixA [Campylobacter gastrosuis]